MRHIVGRTDLLGSFLHNCISAEAFCDTFAGSLFEESSLQAARYAGACLDQLNKLCDMMGLLRPIIDAPPASTLLTREEYETVHLNTQFPDKFLSKMRKRAHCRRNILERFAVVHIRRGDICRDRPDPCRGFSRFVEVAYFRRHVDAIRRSAISRVLVLTEAQNSDDVVQEFSDCEVHAARFPSDSERVVEDWELMATCDVLVLSPSSFSFVPALFNDNTVIYKPFWHAPLPGWIDGDERTCIPRSHRLGNLLDAWYIGTLMGWSKTFHELQKTCESGSFGAFLIQGKFVSPVADTNFITDNTELKLSNTTAIYSYRTVLGLPCIHKDFQECANAFSKQRPSLLNNPYSCVVHYRVGDFLRLGQCIDTESVIRQVEETAPHDFICILSSGVDFDGSNWDGASKMSSSEPSLHRAGAYLLRTIHQSICKALPEARVVISENDVDTDFFLMITAPVLITAASSFAMCAAIANPNTVRTPATVNMNFPKRGQETPCVIRPGWLTYPFKSIEHFQLAPHVVITTDSSNELKRRISDDIKSAGVNVTLLVDSKCDDENLRRQGCIFDHERLCERYGRRKVEVFNGRWRNNAAKLAIFEFVAEQDCDVWAFEDDVYCRDWKAFVGAYAEDRSDFIGSVFHETKNFKEFYVNGWLCGHPDHLSHGVAGLYAFRASPTFARAVLDALKTVRHSSHHELFVPWVCRDFEHSQLLEGHARFMSHNPDPRMNSGMSVDALHESGLIFHPVKKKSKAVYRNSATPNGPKTKLWIIINSFNSSFYVNSAVKLSLEITRQLKTMVPQPRVLLVIGGSKKRRVDSLPMFCACRIQQNLSDYGSFVGVHDALESNVMKKSDRCVLLHDTVWPREDTFFRAMIDIQNTEMYNTPFCFAHPLGWYNLGVGSADFFARMGSQYQNVDILPKELGYKLEHGNTISINGAKLSPLREHSIYTIAKHRVSDGNFGDLTTHSTGAMNIDGRSRVIVFLPSLGVFKFTHGPTSYQVPIYADTDLPRTEEEWRQLQRKYPQMNWCMPLIQIND